MKVIRKILAAVFLIFIVVISVVPFLWVLSSSFKGNAEIMSSVVGYPNGLQFDNYVKAFEIAPLTTFYKNSILVAIIATVLNLLIFSMAAYVLVRCKFRFNYNAIFSSACNSGSSAFTTFISDTKFRTSIRHVDGVDFCVCGVGDANYPIYHDELL